jgi:tRNA A37 threonylcarbamoyladenosine dehydratase
MGKIEDLTLRNQGFISEDTQEALKNLKVLIAGCGSIGGGIIELLVRTGVRNFVLADPDTYDYTNMNRQVVYFNDVEKNKALFLEEKIYKINPSCTVSVYDNGIRDDNITEMLHNIDIIVDGVDVTTKDGWIAKFELHEQAKEKRIPLISGYDMDATQYVIFHDYSNEYEQLFDGRITRKHIEIFEPLVSCVFLIQPKNMPLGIFEELERIEKKEKDFISQLGIAANLYAIITTSMIIKKIEGKKIKKEVYIDLWETVSFYSQNDKNKLNEFRKKWENKIKKISEEQL